VEWLRKLKVSYLRTGLSWADSFRPGAEAWFDRQMQAIEEFNTTLTLCFTPEHLGINPHYTSPPKNPDDFAEFARRMVERYGGPQVGRPETSVASGISEGFAQVP
jgi:beta-xylosidase